MECQPRNRTLPPIEALYRLAKQYSRRPEEVDDLVQDVLLEAVRAGRDFSDTQFLAWGRGFLRNRSAFIARTESRRRKREERFHGHDEPDIIEHLQLPESFVSPLRPSLRVVARLVNCGLNRKEIIYLLDIADTALRQRLTALRREWKAYLERLGQFPEHHRDLVDALSTGLIRQSLTKTVKHTARRQPQLTGRAIGSHDPDGHLFTIRTFSAHKKGHHGNNSDDQGD